MPETRRFQVRARHLGAHHARMVEEASFEAAAVAWTEGGPDAPDEADPQAVTVIVRDCASGHEHCFRIDLESGDAAPCG